MADRLDDWILSHLDVNTDIDGWYGSQCWDLWAAYCLDLLDAPGVWVCTTARTGSNAGYAGSVWEQYPLNDWIRDTFDKLGPNTQPQRGDVAFWGNDATHATTHVAIVIQDGYDELGRVHVLAQNVDASMAARDMWDTTPTDGYLRPKKGTDTDMVSPQDIQDIANAVWNFPQNGTLTRDRLQGTDQAANAASQKADRLAARLDQLEKTVNRQDGRMMRLMLSLKRYTGLDDQDTTSVPDLTRSLLHDRVYRLTLMAKRLFGIPDASMEVPDQIQLSDAQLDAIADRVAQKLNTTTN